MKRTVSQYRKTIVAILGLAVLVIAAFADDRLTGDEWWTIGVAIATALGVYVVPNVPTHDVPPPQ